MRSKNPKPTNYAKPREAGAERRGKGGPMIKADSFLDELKGDVAAYFEINSNESFTQRQVLDHFEVADRKLQLMMHGLIGELTEEGRLTRLPDGSYQANADAGVLEGVVDHVNAKFAFVSIGSGSRDTDIWVPTEDLGGAVDGDKVKVMPFSDSRNRSQRRTEGKVTQVLERGRTEIVGTIELWETYGFVTPDSRKLYEEIYIKKDKLGGAKNGEKVIVKLTQYPTGGKTRFEGEIITVLGKAGDNNTEMHAILAEFGLPNEFPAEVEEEAKAISTKILKKDLKNRRDFREITTFTIDPVDAKDFDDALSVKMLDNGHYEIGIHIADVTHYVLPGSALEDEAYKRATSVYLVDRVVPMLPEALSNNLCSLRPNEDKMTFSAVFELDDNAKIINEWFGRTVIHSDRRFSYEEAQDILNTGAGDYIAELQLLNDLAYKLRDERFRHGAINFETVEVKFKLDENGIPLGVFPKIRQDTNKLIEEFMLLANKRVAEFVHKKSKKGEENTMVYRVHEGPNEDKLQAFSDFAGRLGFKLKLGNPNQLSNSFNQFMDSIEGKPEQNMLQQLAVRTMSKARYSTEDIGHFGLAFARYSHFTSPIRRYPDMMAHRLLQHYLDGGRPADKESLEDRCKHSSNREKMASDAERASIKYKQVEFMSRVDPEQVFSGIISGVTEFGIFVEITENSCEGLVRMADLNDDFYEFDKDNYRIVGQRTKKMLTFGDPVTVKLKETNLGRRSMDFWLVDAEGNRAAGMARSSGHSRSDRSSRPSSGSRSRSMSSQAKGTKGAAPKGQNRRGGRKS